MKRDRPAAKSGASAGNNTEFRKIVVAFDGSQNSVRALKVAGRIAESRNAKLIVVHVYVPPVYYYYGPMGLPAYDVGRFEETMKKEADETAKKAAQIVRESGVEGNAEVLESRGSVVQALSEFAANEKADLIVIGTRGLGGFKKMLLGSVSSGVVQHAPCSVLVVR
jgi:nucleotide-binding universal stress UspA family protein